MLEPLVNDPILLTQIGRLSQASAWEILHLKTHKAETEATTLSTPTVQPPMSPELAEQSTAAPVEVTTSVPELLAQQRSGLDASATKEKSLTAEQRNQANIKTVLHAFSNVTQSLFSGGFALSQVDMYQTTLQDSQNR